MNERAYVMQIVKKLKVGEVIIIDRRLFEDAFPCGHFSIYNNPMQAFLSSMIGSAWGGWRVNRSPESGDYTVSRHEESDKRYYVDPDREHLFKRMPDGTLERR